MAKVRAVLIDGKPYQRKADGSLVPLKGKTDWQRLNRQMPAQIEAIAQSDRDGPPMSDDEWAKAAIVQPQKVPVGLKLDDDVLGWFKSQGKGYQTRINAIVRHYYETHRKVSYPSYGSREPERDFRIMKEPGIDGRHRDKSGEIQQKRSDTLNKNLSKPIPQFSPNATLGTMRERTGKVSEEAVRRAAAKKK